MDSDTKAQTTVDPWDAALLGGSVAQTAASMYTAAPKVAAPLDVAVPFPPPPPLPPLPQSAVIPTAEQREKTGIPRDVVSPVSPTIVPNAPAPAPVTPFVRMPDFTKLSIKPTPLMQTRPIASVVPPRPLVMPRVPPPSAPFTSPPLANAAPVAPVTPIVPPRPVVAPLATPPPVVAAPRPQVTIPAQTSMPMMNMAPAPQLPSTEISPAFMKTAAAVLAIPLFGFGFLFADVAKNVVAKIQKGSSIAAIISSIR